MSFYCFGDLRDLLSFPARRSSDLSVTVHDLVTLRLQPLPCSAPTVPVAVNPLLQLSLAEATPKPPAIFALVCLQGIAEEVANVMTGTIVSRLAVTVCEAVPGLPHT